VNEQRSSSSRTVRFLLLGAFLFVAYAWVNRGASGRPETGAGTVRIGAKEIAWLTETWGRQQQREPTREELRGLVAAFLKEELLSREAPRTVRGNTRRVQPALENTHAR
jgi:hypothetical protein